MAIARTNWWRWTKEQIAGDSTDLGQRNELSGYGKFSDNIKLPLQILHRAILRQLHRSTSATKNDFTTNGDKPPLSSHQTSAKTEGNKMPNHATLVGKKIAFLATDGVEQVELTEPWAKIKAAGAAVHLIAPKTGWIQGVHHDQPGDRFRVDKSIDEAVSDDYDGLVLPGGVANPDALRVIPACVEFVRDFFKLAKPVAAICHGPWMLIEADVVHERRVTSWPSLKTDLVNAGAEWVDEACVCDEGLVTSRNPGDLDAFCEKAIAVFSEGLFVGQTV